MNINQRMENFDEFLKQFENIQIPDLDQFNLGMIEYQEGIKEIKFLRKEEKDHLCQYMIEHVENFQELLQICIYSILAYFFNGGCYAKKLLDLVRNSTFLLEDNKYFIYSQLSAYSFRVKDYLDSKSGWELRMLYRDIYQGYRTQLGITSNVVPMAERNKGIVVFLINQYLNELHGPTKTVLDRCEVIAEKMGAAPVIINTAELCGSAGYIPFFMPLFGNYMEALQDTRSVEYHGKQFPYMQCSEMMPNTQEIAGVIQTVRHLNPYCVFQVGSASVCADLCSNFYPLITIGTVPSSIMTSEGQFLLKGKPITEKDREYIKQLGFSENYLQYCLFTSSFNEQKGKVTREQYGIPEDAFTALIVGGRLDFEVDETFIEEVLHPIIERGIVPVFMGSFENYGKRTEQYPFLKNHSVYVGFIDDVLAVNEICDIYVNPRRNGGGTSVVEAMAKKLPPVTLDYGDVALGAGEEFCVEDYSAMVQRILRLREDKEYYAAMSEKAYERMNIVTNSRGIFWEVFQRIEQLPEFR